MSSPSMRRARASFIARCGLTALPLLIATTACAPAHPHRAHVVRHAPHADVIYVRHAPPALRIEKRSVRPVAGAVWVGGYWRWTGARYVWIDGYWDRSPRGHAWAPGHWEKTRRGWYWIPGHWRR